MAGEQAMTSATGSTVDWSLGTALVSGDSRLEQLKLDGQRIGDVLKVTTQEAVRLGNEFKNSQERAAQSARDWLGALGRIYSNLHGQIDAVNTLTGLYQKLGKAMQSAQLPAAGLPAPDHGATVIDAARPVLGKTRQALGNSNDYQQILNDITIKANLLVAQPAAGLGPERAEEARQQTIANVPAIISQISAQSGMGKTEAAGLTRDMLDAGVDFSSLEALAPLAAKFSVGQGVDAKDTAALFRTMQNSGVQVGDMEKVLNAWIDQARNGGKVSVGDLTQMMPRLGATLAENGQQGADALIRAGQMVQERGQKLGTSIQISADVQTAIGDKQLPALQPRTSSFNYVDEELNKRRQDPAQRQKEMDNSFTNLSTSIGDSLQSWVAPFVTSLTGITNGLTKLTDAHQGVVGAVVALGVAAGGLKVFGAISKGRELLGNGATSSAEAAGSAGGQRTPGLFSRFGAAAGRTARKLLPGGRFVDAGLTVVDLFRSNTTRNEKIQGVSTAAGGLGGTMAGAAAGAALGSVVPVAGTLLGGLIGGMLGGMAGEAVGDRAGKVLQSKKGQSSPSRRQRGGHAGEFAGDLASTAIVGAVFTQIASNTQPQVSATLPVETKPPATEQGGAMLKSSMTNTSTANFAVTPAININVQGILTNPTELVSVLRPEVERMFANLAARASTGTEMFDLPGPPPTLITA